MVFCCSLLYLHISFILFQDVFKDLFFVPGRRLFFRTEQFVWVCSSFGYSWKTENAILFYTETFGHDEHTKLAWGHGQYPQQQHGSALRVNRKANQFWCRGPDVHDIQLYGFFTSD